VLRVVRVGARGFPGRGHGFFRAWPIPPVANSARGQFRPWPIPRVDCPPVAFSARGMPARGLCLWAGWGVRSGDEKARAGWDARVSCDVCVRLMR
jgi:hypothetical protein